ncbi:hypothetical protein [Streptomyces sp. NPDC006925]|uniref:hypothetical protein n=1 Tax=Streptomyces sp. NPDC006925 TaxID=3364768 RepID=UPI0036CB2415
MPGGRRLRGAGRLRVGQLPGERQQGVQCVLAAPPRGDRRQDAAVEHPQEAPEGVRPAEGAQRVAVRQGVVGVLRGGGAAAGRHAVTGNRRALAAGRSSVATGPRPLTVGRHALVRRAGGRQGPGPVRRRAPSTTWSSRQVTPPVATYSGWSISGAPAPAASAAGAAGRTGAGR